MFNTLTFGGECTTVWRVGQWARFSEQYQCIEEAVNLLVANLEHGIRKNPNSAVLLEIPRTAETVGHIHENNLL